MKLFQKMYDWIESWTTPDWLKPILQFLNDVIMSIAMQIGRETIDKIKQKIIEVDNNVDLSGEEKFKVVAAYVVEIAPTLSKKYINLLVETLVNKLKDENIIN